MMTSLWKQITRNISSTSQLLPPASSRTFSSRSPYLVKVGIPEFVNGIGNGVETHAHKLESEFGDLQTLLVARTFRLRRLEIPVEHRKLILKYAHKYRLGLWRPRADQVKV